MLDGGRMKILERDGAAAFAVAQAGATSVRLVDRYRRPSLPEAAPAPAPRHARLLDAAERVPAIEAALAALRPRLQADGGDCRLVDVVDDVVRVRLTGACVGCQLSTITVLGVRMRLIEALGRPIKVVPV